MDKERLLRILRQNDYIVRGGAGTQKEGWLRHKYGLGRMDLLNRMIAQDGHCACCGKDLDGVNWCIDHNHATGQVRDLVCYTCNTAIRAIEQMRCCVAYLRKHGETI